MYSDLLDFCEPSHSGHLNKVVLSLCGLISWLSYFKCSVWWTCTWGGMPIRGCCHSPHGSGPHPGFPSLLTLQQCFLMAVVLQWTPPQCSYIFLPSQWHSQTGNLQTCRCPRPSQTLLFSILMQRVAEHLLPCGSILFPDDLSRWLHSGLCLCGAFTQRWRRTMQPVTTFGFFPLLPRVYRFIKAVCIRFFSHGNSLHEHGRVLLMQLY